MTKETIETTNKLIIPNSGEDDKSKELFESLEAISDEEIMQAGEEVEQTITNPEKDEDIREKKDSEKKSNTLDNNGDWKQLGDIKYNKEEKIIIRRGKTFNFYTDLRDENFISEVVSSMNKNELEKISFVLKEIGEGGHAYILDSIIIPSFD